MAITPVKQTPPGPHRENRFFPPVRQDMPAGRHDNEPAKMALQSEPPGAAAETRRKRPLTRPMAPFLAQLSLQYDDITAARRKRREQLEAAVQSYAGAGFDGATPAQGHRRDLRT